jgi:hypothetical protein
MVREEMTSLNACMDAHLYCVDMRFGGVFARWTASTRSPRR